MVLKFRTHWFVLFVSYCQGIQDHTHYHHYQSLPQLNAKSAGITLSGFSSGGTFAQQLQFSYSSLFSGIGIFSTDYYRCGPGDGNPNHYDIACTTLGSTVAELSTKKWTPDRALRDINSYYKRGLIENPNNLKDTKLYIYSGTNNIYFTIEQSLSTINIYEPFIGNRDLIKTRIQSANFSLPNNRYGTTCSGDPSGQSYISNCGLAGAYEALHWLLGDKVIIRPPPERLTKVELQTLQKFDQTEFFDKGRNPSMDHTGFYYVPKNCSSHSQRYCHLHLYFHGCFVGREFSGEKHIRNSGYLEVAELNNIIMLFPQAISHSPNNPHGCWDVYGINGPLYATRVGPQVLTVRQMLFRILGDDLNIVDQSHTYYHRPAPETVHHHRRPVTESYRHHLVKPPMYLCRKRHLFSPWIRPC